MPKQQALPAWVVLNVANDVSPSGMADVYTGQPYMAGGLNVGDYFDLAAKEAFRNCKPSVGVLYYGRYRRILVDPSSTPANIKTGSIGFMSPPADAAVAFGKIGGANPITANIISDYAHALDAHLRPVVFLNAITPGNYGWVQELGVASVLGDAGITAGAIGATVSASATTGLAVITGGAAPLGVAIDVPTAGVVFRILMQGVPVVQD